MLREIVLDTETTGTDPAAGDRVIEIGGVELVNHIPTGRTFHVYLNPECRVSEGALEVHGLSNAFLADKPRFAAIAEEFESFLGDGRLVIHNAAFDVAFLNAELHRLGRPSIEMGRAVDTLALARRKHPGAPNNLDALCARYGVDNTRRTKHGALLDAEILAEVYIELLGGKQADLGLTFARPAAEGIRLQDAGATVTAARAFSRILSRLTDPERETHRAFVESLGSGAIWRDYLGQAEGREQAAESAPPRRAQATG